MNCEHKFMKKGGWIQTWSYNESDVRYIQEMECKKCKITTYYPSDAFKSNGELV